jgi:hypothetical protein
VYKARKLRDHARATRELRESYERATRELRESYERATRKLTFREIGSVEVVHVVTFDDGADTDENANDRYNEP